MPLDAPAKNSSKRLVIFGCGYIGSAMARAAVSRGWRVTALTRNPAKAEFLQNNGIPTVVADLAGSDWHERVEGAPDFVLNCVSSGGGGTDAYRRSYVEGMASILTWIKKQGPVGTLVYTSSTSVYPQADGTRVDELSATGGSERAEILLTAESLLRQAATAYQRCFVLRLAGIYGPARHHLLNQVRQGEIAGPGDYRLNLAHRDDITAAVWACFVAPATVGSEIFNVADDQPAAKTEVVAWLASRLNVPPPTFTAEALSGRRSHGTDRVISNSRLKAALDWRPGYPTFREGYASLLSL
ncbi:MAG: hypothetical protein RIQ93_3129 [Verrucomicrobiota bacterium]|jgi:nucleoside-diphosphate-sugar epimerase